MKENTRKVMETLAEQAKNIMVNGGIKCSSESEVDRIILDYMNAKTKLISNQKRNVEFSDELRQKISDGKFDREGVSVNEEEAKEIVKLVEFFKCKFENGESINYHLSRQAFDSTRFDTLLNIWNIKHIHLSDRTSSSKRSMKNNRSEWLLFCIIENDTVYFLDVLNHPTNEHFTAYHFLQVVHRNNWMNHIGFEEIKCLAPGLLITKDEDIHKIYESKINIPFEFDGKLYMSLGVASSGDKVTNSMRLIGLKKFLNNMFSQDSSEYLCIKFDSEDSLNGTLYLRESSYRLPTEDILN